MRGRGRRTASPMPSGGPSSSAASARRCFCSSPASPSRSASSKVARGATPAEASAAVRKRGWQIFGLAFLFRLQAVLLGGGRWRSLLRVDVLNIMGPSIAAAAYPVARRRRLPAPGLCAADGRHRDDYSHHPRDVVPRSAARSGRGLFPATARSDDVHVLPVGGVRLRGSDDWSAAGTRVRHSGRATAYGTALRRRSRDRAREATPRSFRPSTRTRASGRARQLSSSSEPASRR